MTDTSSSSAQTSGAPVVVVTGANGLVGSRVCAALSDRGAHVRAVVRREGTAPSSPTSRSTSATSPTRTWRPA